MLLFLCLSTGGVFSTGCLPGSGLSLGDPLSSSWNAISRWCNEITPLSRQTAKSVAYSLSVNNAQVSFFFFLLLTDYSILIEISMKNLISRDLWHT